MPVTYVRNPNTGVFEEVGFNTSATDTTLSQAGKPADAAAVGNALAAKSNIVEVESVSESVVAVTDRVDIIENEVATLKNHSHLLADLGVQCGRQTVDCTANTVSTATVTFAKKYASAPVVTATAGSSAPGTAVTEVTVSNITTTGFAICVYRTNTSATSIQWIAVGSMA